MIPCHIEAEGVGVVQPGEEKAQGRPYSNLPVTKGGYRRAGEGVPYPQMW